MPFRGMILVLVLSVSAGCADQSEPSASVPTRPPAEQESIDTEEPSHSPPTADNRLTQPISLEPLDTDEGGPQELTEDPAATSPIAFTDATDVESGWHSFERPVHNDDRLAELGIHRYDSDRLTLYTDIDPTIAATLPPLIDQVYPVWVEYFGELPERDDGGTFQLTGYLMGDADPFIAAGVLPEEFRSLQHGQHRGLEFWMYDQPTDYYRRHLLIHEATHCYMTVEPTRQIPPLWYLEGMAELLGVHRLGEDGRATFGFMPETSESVQGFGRVELIQQMVAEGRGLTVAGVNNLGVPEFSESRSEPYAWSWAFCKFLDAHPRYRDRFHELCLKRDGLEFLNGLDAAFRDDMSILWIEWELFISQIEYGHQIDRAAIDFQGGEELAHGESVSIDVAADRGWQPSGIRIEAGRTYRITATGEITLADEPTPWVSTPRGVSIRYAHARPIGKLLAGIVGEGPPGEIGTCGLLHPIEVNEAAQFTAAESGTLYLRINDFWSELDDNRGGYVVEVEG